MSKFFLCLFFLSLFGISHGQNKFSLAEDHFDKARNHYRNHEFDLAREEVNRSLKYRSSADAHYLSGVLFEEEGKGLRALSEYEAAIKKNANYNEAYFKKALIYLHYNNPEQAVKDFDHLLSQGTIGETRSVYFEIDATGDSQNSIMTLQGMKARLYSYRGQSYQKLGKLDKAFEDYSKSIELNPRPDFYISRALLSYSQQREKEAIADLKSAIAIQSDKQLAWYNLLLIDPQAEIPAELGKNNFYAPTLNLLAVKAFENTDYKLAIKFYNQVLEQSEDALAFVNRGRALSKLERYEEARRDFNKAKYIEPSRVETLYLIGNTYFFEKEYESAVAFYNQYLSVDPFHAMTWYNGAMANLELDNSQEACNMLARAYDLGMTESESIIKSKCK
ncbi:MAG: tetratricopeptide repeat protein [Cyclobacteriaceae bacterium]